MGPQHLFFLLFFFSMFFSVGNLYKLLYPPECSSFIKFIDIKMRAVVLLCVLVLLGTLAITGSFSVACLNTIYCNFLRLQKSQFSDKKIVCFHISASNTDCGYSSKF